MINIGGSELAMMLGVMLPGMLAIFLILKHERDSAILLWIIAVFAIPVLGWLSYLVKYFLIDKRRTL
jgi:hypothetical protein